MKAYWEIAAHSAYDMFAKHKYIIVNLVFPTTDFGVEISPRLRFCLQRSFCLPCSNTFLPYICFIVKSELEKMRCFGCNFISKIHISGENEKRHSVTLSLDTKINVDTVSGCGFHSVTFRRSLNL